MKQSPTLMVVILLFTSWIGSTRAQLWEKTGGGMKGFVHHLSGDTALGILYAYGYFDTAGTTPVCRLAGWDGTNWSRVGMLPGDTACPYYPYPSIIDVISWDDYLFAGGNFDLPPYTSGSIGIIKWDGNVWTGEDTQDGGVFQVANGQLFSLGYYRTVNGIKVGRIIKWNEIDNQWERFCDSLPFEQSGDYILTVAYYQGRYYFGGNFDLAAGYTDVAAWDGTRWDSLSGGLRGGISGVADMQSYQGQLFVGGLFYGGAGNPANHLIAWNGTQWYNPFPYVYFVAQVHDLDIVDGILYIAGAHQVWDGNAWSSIHSLARYDGNQFCSFGGPNVNAVDMEIIENELYVINNNTTPQSPHGILTWLGGDSLDICISQPVSASPPATPALSFSIFPNPGEGQVQVRWEASKPGPVEIEVHDIYGRKISSKSLLQRDGSNTAELDLGQLPAGTYLVRMLSGDGQVTVKYVRL